MYSQDSVVNSRGGLSTQDTYTTLNDLYRSQTDDLMNIIGLGSLVKEKSTSSNAVAWNNPKPPTVESRHKRTSTEISDLSQFENVDEEIEGNQPINFNLSQVKRSPLPKGVGNQVDHLTSNEKVSK